MEDKKFDLKDAFALWENKKEDKIYFTGKTAGDNPIRLVGFYNTVKKNPNSPDLTIYESAEKGSKAHKEVASLWEEKSKAGKQYYTGSMADKQKIVAFVNGNTQEGKYPAIRAYYK